MSDHLTIALDAMGGDHGPPVTVAGARLALAADPRLRILFVGQEDVLEPLMAELPAERVSLVHAADVIAMTDRPARALRGKRGSSMHLALSEVRDGRAAACVSAGNTGALMAISRHLLGTLPAIERPAILAQLPSVSGHTYALDLGANVDSSADVLFQFALMGSALASAVDGIERPRIGLLNIGEEEIKGNDSVKQAASLMQQSNLNYIGFVEGDDIYTGEVDVVVCDGFVGNIALKASEGVARMINALIKEEIGRGLGRRLMGMAAAPLLRSLKRRLDPRRHNGATLAGLNKVVVKSHGNADAKAIANALNVARIEARRDVPGKIGELLASSFDDPAES